MLQVGQERAEQGDRLCAHHQEDRGESFGVRIRSPVQIGLNGLDVLRFAQSGQECGNGAYALLGYPDEQRRFREGCSGRFQGQPTSPLNQCRDHVPPEGAEFVSKAGDCSDARRNRGERRGYMSYCLAGSPVRSLWPARRVRPP